MIEFYDKSGNKIPDGEVTLYLTRRNLESLLNKLDANKSNPGTSHCTLIKNDIVHPVYPITGANSVTVIALEDDQYYTDREPGPVVKYYGELNIKVKL